MEEETKTLEEMDISDKEVEMHMPEGMTVTEKHNSSFAIILAVLLVLLVMILGGLYLWGAALETQETQQEVPAREIPNNEPETPRAEADTQILNTVSPSDELDAIEADINSTELDSLDAELEEIERELDAARVE